MITCYLPFLVTEYSFPTLCQRFAAVFSLTIYECRGGNYKINLDFMRHGTTKVSARRCYGYVLFASYSKRQLILHYILSVYDNLLITRTFSDFLLPFRQSLFQTISQMEKTNRYLCTTLEICTTCTMHNRDTRFRIMYYVVAKIFIGLSKNCSTCRIIGIR